MRLHLHCRKTVPPRIIFANVVKCVTSKPRGLSAVSTVCYFIIVSVCACAANSGCCILSCADFSCNAPTMQILQSEFSITLACIVFHYVCCDLAHVNRCGSVTGGISRDTKTV